MKRTLLVPALCAGLALAGAPLAAQAKPDGAKAAQEAGKAQDASARKAVQVGSEVNFLKDVTLKTATGTTFSFAEWFKAKDAKESDKPRLLVLSFWAVECPYQKHWDPTLSELSQEFRAKNVSFVGIASNITEPPDAVAKAAKERNIPYPILLDEGQKLADWFGAKTTPHVYVINGQGKVIYTGAVDNDSRGELGKDKRKNYLRDAIEQTLAGQPLAVSNTPPVGCSIKRGKASL